MEQRVKVLITKLGLDWHHFGPRLVAAALRDAGMEVIYLAGDMSPEQVAEVAAQEDVDVVGVSMHSGSYFTLLPDLLTCLRERDQGDVMVIVGGIIPKDDRPALRDMGIAEVFGPETHIHDIVSFINAHLPTAQGAA